MPLLLGQHYTNNENGWLAMARAKLANYLLEYIVAVWLSKNETVGFVQYLFYTLREVDDFVLKA